MGFPAADLEAVRSSTNDLIRWLQAAQWSEADVAAPSLLPGWTRGHVLTHIARNADGIAHTLSGALRGENLPRYPAGPPGRNADIEAGAGRPVADLIADVRGSAARLDRVFGELAAADPSVWERTADDRAASAYPAARRQEVEIHRVDLDAGYMPGQWPASFVERMLPQLGSGLAERAGVGALRVEVLGEGSVTGLVGRVWTAGDPAEAVEVAGPDWALLAWLLGRAAAAGPVLSAAPELPAWR